MNKRVLTAAFLAVFSIAVFIPAFANEAQAADKLGWIGPVYKELSDSLMKGFKEYYKKTYSKEVDITFIHPGGWPVCVDKLRAWGNKPDADIFLGAASDIFGLGLGAQPGIVMLGRLEFGGLEHFFQARHHRAFRRSLKSYASGRAGGGIPCGRRWWYGDRVGPARVGRGFGVWFGAVGVWLVLHGAGSGRNPTQMRVNRAASSAVSNNYFWLRTQRIRLAASIAPA